MSDPLAETPTARDGRVVVVAGGLSHERDVSIRSGRRVSEALREAGYEVDQRDCDGALLPSLQADPPACVVPLLHGETGEDGSIREILELLEIPFVGSPAAACRLAFDKPVAKTVVAGHGVSTPAAVVLPHETFRELGAPAVMELLVARLGLPLVVKPTRGGSSLGCHVVTEARDLPGAMVGAFAYGPVAIVETFVAGIEVAVGVVDGPDGPRALPPVSITPAAGVYDYNARYTAGETEFVVPAGLRHDLDRACAEVALTAHRALGLRDLSRSDLIIAPDDTVWFLEANVAPGMTETSLVPLAVGASDESLQDLCASLVRTAIAR